MHENLERNETGQFKSETAPILTQSGKISNISTTDRNHNLIIRPTVNPLPEETGLDAMQIAAQREDYAKRKALELKRQLEEVNKQLHRGSVKNRRTKKKVKEDKLGIKGKSSNNNNNSNLGSMTNKHSRSTTDSSNPLITTNPLAAQNQNANSYLNVNNKMLNPAGGFSTIDGPGVSSTASRINEENPLAKRKKTKDEKDAAFKAATLSDSDSDSSDSEDETGQNNNNNNQPMWGSANQNQGNLPNFGSSNSNKQLLDKYSALAKKEQSHEAMLNKHQNDTLRDSVSPLENENNRYPSNEFNNNNNDPNSTSLPSNNATYGSSVLPDSSQNSIASISNGGVSNTIDQTSSSSGLNNNNNNIGGTINSTNDQNSLPVNHMIDPKNNIENGNVEDEEMKIQKMREAEKKRREEQLKKETGIMGLTEQNEMMNQFERGFY